MCKKHAEIHHGAGWHAEIPAYSNFSRPLSGVVMIRSGRNDTLKLCIVLGAAFCGSLVGQTTSNGQSDPSAAAPAAQSDAPAPGARSDTSYVIGADDVLTINVWKEPELSHSVPVRSDGKISMPLVGELQAAGRTPFQLEENITAELRRYITEPQVTVIVQQTNSLKFNILGQVTKPGSYPLTGGTTIVDAVAAAGGFRDFAKKKGIYILRQDGNGNETRIPFNYDQYIKGKNTAQNIKLKPHDTIIVP
jgi:polysaccharide biosynthesis/export protein